jgi:phosphatidylinositol-4-phosphate 3-kinase
MVATGIEELNTNEGVQYIIESLCLTKSDEEASAHFKDLIAQSINSLATQINFFVHNVAQQSSRKKTSSPKMEEPTTTSPSNNFLTTSAKLFQGSVTQIKNRFSSGDSIETNEDSADDPRPRSAR